MIPLTLLALLAADPGPIPADVVLRGGTVFDGSGQPGVVGDVAIKGDRIVAVGKFAVAGKPKIARLHGSGRRARLHRPAHAQRQRADPGSPTRANLNYLTQGVTTVVTGNCGSGPDRCGRLLQGQLREERHRHATSSTRCRTTPCASRSWATSIARRPPTN